MAKGNVFLTKATGSVGNVTLSVVHGQQVVKAKITKTTNRKTVAQVAQRVRWRYLKLFYSMASAILDHSFTIRKSTESSMNKFYSENASLAPIVQKKQVAWRAESYSGIDLSDGYSQLNLAPLKMSDGTLLAFDNYSVNWKDKSHADIPDWGFLATPLGLMANAERPDVADQTIFVAFDDTISVDYPVNKFLADILRENGFEINEMLTICYVTGYRTPDNVSTDGLINDFKFIRIKLVSDSSDSTFPYTTVIEYSSPSTQKISYNTDLFYLSISDSTINTAATVADIDGLVVFGFCFIKSKLEGSSWSAAPSYMNIFPATWPGTDDVIKYVKVSYDFSASNLRLAGYEVESDPLLDPASIVAE